MKLTLTITYTRDQFGRIASKTTGGANPVSQTYTYNARNLLETARDTTGGQMNEVERTYDSAGGIRRETVNGKTVSYSINWDQTSYTLNSNLIYPNSSVKTETTVKGKATELTYGSDKLLQYNYGPGDTLESIYKNFDTNGNHQTALTYDYDKWRRTSNRYEEILPSTDVANYTYTYSKGDHLTAKENSTANSREAYQHDSYYRLRRVDYACAYDDSDPTCKTNRENFRCNSGEAECESFTMDGAHNIVSSLEGGISKTWTIDDLNRLIAQTDGTDTYEYEYDERSNMICVKLNGAADCTETYTYDDLNRLVQYETADLTVIYSYDAFNRRLFKITSETVNSYTIETTYTYTYDDWNIIEEEIHALNITANPEVTTAWEIRRYVDSGMDNHIIMDTSPVTDGTEGTAEKIWFHKDERGNIIAISNNTGIILERYKYKVYGEHKVLDANFVEKTTEAISPFLWGGSLYEPETDLYWMRNRYYSKEMKRFINVDPLGIWGDANNLGNGFAYVAGMVVEASDPTGLDYTDADETQAQITVDGDKMSPTFHALHVLIKFDDSIYITAVTRTDESTEMVDENGVPITYGAYNQPLYDGREGEVVLNHIRAKQGVYFKKTDEYYGPIVVKFHELLELYLRMKFGYEQLDAHDIAVDFEAIIAYEIEQSDSGKGVFLYGGGQNSFTSSYDGFNCLTGQNINSNNNSNPTEGEDKDKEGAEEGKKGSGASVTAGGEGTTVTFERPGGNYVGKPVDNPDGSQTYTMDDGTKVTVKDGKITGCDAGSSGNCDGYKNGDSFQAKPKYPADPYDDVDRVQVILRNNLLKKMLKLGTPEQSSTFRDSTGPNGTTRFYKNPYYRKKDPVKAILTIGHDGSGRPVLTRNPLAAPNGSIQMSAASALFYSGFNYGNIDPWFE